MTLFGFHASHEQIHPAALLRAVQRAEAAGFEAAMCSDHFAPWNTAQGHSGFAWSWLGAALATTDLRLGVVNAPGQRYHPAIVAQAIGTLGAMFPGRFWAALGSGENMNEHITGDPWPRKDVRDARLEESIDVIKRLLAGETVTHDGLVTVDRARLWTLPDPVPALIAPAVTVATARRMAAWADGLVTINQPLGTLREMVAAYRDAGGRGRVVLQVHLAWDPDADRAERMAFEQWRTNLFAPPLPWDLDTPEAFEQASVHVRPQDVHQAVKISADLEQHTAWLLELAEVGFDEVYLHHVGTEQEAFIETFGEQVLPRLREAVGERHSPPGRADTAVPAGGAAR
ncbi:5,10-methylene tetrahydromethanopterin reductase [Actinotalea ferrariae CF5-4]|uniref:5,10-methylene tetrahydromethanopterin reductase n=1 Tax=Actinotalea ferrariae CF5-4 TaxID=948458 RepID=A0A021VYI9_9CELL|nr:TIGR03885 family FMN-dependent LLM class oxidoreductase [Actinotalea ferrariae]EYR64137.1 5,10-methylene tetrahydromethanopterin reductase [Actinotalea ferrariae CF5-4]